MEQLRFSTRVLGQTASNRLERYQVTQTLRSLDSSITQAILRGRLKIGDQMEITLDDKIVGLAQYVMLEIVNWGELDGTDAKRGGFDSPSELEKALKRTGYRFKPIDMYNLYRLQFSWLGETHA